MTMRHMPWIAFLSHSSGACATVDDQNRYYTWSCERIVYNHGAILLIVRECSGFNPRRWRHCEVDVQVREQVDSGREKVEVRDKEKGDKSRTNNARSIMWHHGWHVDGMTAHLRHLEPRCECDHICKVDEKKTCERCSCLHHPSVTVDRYRL